MKVDEIMQEAADELKDEKKSLAKEFVKERLREIDAAERTLAEMKAQLTALRDKDIAEVAADVVDA